jgi:anti-sigma regulatory factor (Ser/Thr protein kinase)
MTTRDAFKTLSISLFSYAILLMIFPGFFASLFGLSDPSFMAQAKAGIRLFAVSEPLFALNYLIIVIFQLSKRNHFSILISCVQALMVIPLLLFAASINNETLMWLSFAIAQIFVFGIVWLLSIMARRKQPQLAPITLIDAPAHDEAILDFSVPCDPTKIGELMDTMHHFLQGKNLTPRCNNAIEICGEELVLNIMQHSFHNNKARYIDIRLRLQADKALLCVTDDGIPFDPIKYDSTGIGLMLVKKLCSEIQYARTLNQNVVNATFIY